jgi:hypothetical protein
MLNPRVEEPFLRVIARVTSDWKTMNRSRIMHPIGLVWAALLVLASSSGAAAAVLIAEFELSDQVDRHRASLVSQSDDFDGSSSPAGDSSSAPSAGLGSQNSKASSAAGSSSSPSLSNNSNDGGASAPQAAGQFPTPAALPPAVGSVFDGIATDPISLTASPAETTDLGFGSPFSYLPPALTAESIGYSSAANQSDSGDLGVNSLVDVSPTALVPAPEASAMIVWGALIVTALVGCVLRSRLSC